MDSPRPDIVALLSANKRDLVVSRIEMLVEQLDVRRAINGEILRGIQQDDLSCGTQAANSQDPTADYHRLEHELLLNRERRGELAAYFRDTALLRDKLLEAVLAYKDVRQKANMMDYLG